jgi:hypothetical protein
MSGEQGSASRANWLRDDGKAERRDVPAGAYDGAYREALGDWIIAATRQSMTLSASLRPER